MPEYSSTTITPADGVQVPSMNGSTSGNFLLSALKSYILAEKGQANGLASLGSDGKLTAAQLPDLADDVIVVASYAVLPAAGTAGKIYITADNNKLYRWDPDLETPDYVELSVDLSAYATKAELAAEESARETEDSRLKSAIQGNSQRIENLEVAVSGSLVQTNTDATMANTKTITNANEILPWAIMKRVGARSVVWKSMLLHGNCVDRNLTDYWGLGSNTQCSQQSDGALLSAISGSGNKYIYSSEIHDYIQGHKYLHIIKCAVMTGSIVISLNGISGNAVTISEMPFGVTAKSVIANASGSARTQITFDNADSMKLAYITTIDVTPMSSYSDAELQAIFCGAYYPYNAGSIIPLNPSAFKVVGKNKADVSDATSASNVVSAVGDDGLITFEKVTFATWSNGPIGYIDLEANTSYVLSVDNLPYGRFGLSSTDSAYPDVTPIKFSSGNTGVSPTNKSRVFVSAIKQRAYIWYCTDTQTGDAQVFSAYFQCEIGSTATAYEPYSETTIDTSFTSDYKYVNENCYDYSENVLVNGVLRRKEHKGIVGSYTFTGTENLEYTTQRWRIQISGIKKVATGADVGNLTLATYLTTSTSVLSSDKSQKYVAVDNSSDYVYLVNPNALNSGDLATMQTDLTGKTLYYEKATPSTPTLHDPIPNFPCEDGTTVTAVTPQTDLVNAIDIPSTIAYMTKIGG